MSAVNINIYDGVHSDSFGMETDLELVILPHTFRLNKSLWDIAHKIFVGC